MPDANGDCGRSIPERYELAEGQLRAIETAGGKPVAEGLMPEEDLALPPVAACNFGRPHHDVRL